MSNRVNVFFYNSRNLPYMSDDELKNWNKEFAKIMCNRHGSQFKNNCGYCQDEINRQKNEQKEAI
jgi:hypothetical protein